MVPDPEKATELADRFDPILFEVIRNALVEATEEMSVSLQRTSYSTNIKTRLDYSCAYVDAQGRMVAQAFCQPAHLVTIGRLVPRAVEEYGAENLEPGDILLVNDPHRQASHLNDVFLISPFFYRDQLAGYVSNTCHHVDVGGGAPASIGAFREIYQEGFILPVVKLVSRGEIDGEVWKLFLANVRAKKEVAGDLRAQIAANNMGMRRLSALFDRYGRDTLDFYVDKLLEYTEDRARAELESLPRGTFEAQGWLDDDGVSDRPVHLKARVTLDGRSVRFDFTGSDRQRAAPMNSNLTQTFTACVYVLKCLLDPDIPVNEGLYQLIEVVAPAGSAVNARRPGAIVGGWEVSVRLCEVLFKALAPALPHAVPAGTKGMICQVGFGGEGSPQRRILFLLRNGGRRLRGQEPDRRSRRGPDPLPEHAERAHRGDREQLSGADHALRVDPRFGGPGPAPRRIGPLPGVRFRGTRTLLHHSGGPGPVSGVGVIWGPRRQNGALCADRRKRGDGPPVQGDGAAREGTVGSAGVLWRRGIRLPLRTGS